MRERAAVMKPRKSLIEPNHLSRFDGIERKEYRWHQTLQINEAVGGRAQNDDRNSDAVRFCWYGISWSIVIRISKAAACAAASRTPFFRPANFA